MITIKIMITSKIAIMIKNAEFSKNCAAQAGTRQSKSSFVTLPPNLYSLGQHKAIEEQIRAECCKICAA